MLYFSVLVILWTEHMIRNILKQFATIAMFLITSSSYYWCSVAALIPDCLCAAFRVSRKLRYGWRMVYWSGQVARRLLQRVSYQRDHCTRTTFEFEIEIAHLLRSPFSFLMPLLPVVDSRRWWHFRIKSPKGLHWYVNVECLSAVLFVSELENRNRNEEVRLNFRTSTAAREWKYIPGRWSLDNGIDEGISYQDVSLVTIISFRNVLDG